MNMKNTSILVQFIFFELADEDRSGVEIVLPSGRRFSNFKPVEEEEDLEFWANQTEAFRFPLTEAQFIAGLPSNYNEIPKTEEITHETEHRGSE